MLVIHTAFNSERQCKIFFMASSCCLGIAPFLTLSHRSISYTTVYLIIFFQNKKYTTATNNDDDDFHSGLISLRLHRTFFSAFAHFFLCAPHFFSYVVDDDEDSLMKNFGFSLALNESERERKEIMFINLSPSY